MSLPRLIAAVAGDEAFAAFGGVVMFVFGFAGLVLFIAWIVFPLLMSSRISEVLKELRRQTGLLEQIARNTRPPEPPGAAVKPAGSLSYMRDEQKVPVGTVLLIMLGLGAVVLLIVALAGKK